MTADSKDRTTFHAITNSTKSDWEIISAHDDVYRRDLATRVLEHLQILKGETGGFAVDRFEHSLQSATLAFRDGMDEEYVVCALLHDMGDHLCSYNHAALAAAVLKPFISRANHWMLAHHGIFLGYYYFHHLDGNRDQRDKYRGHPSFERTALFCARHDQRAFDPNYDTMPLEAFVPMVQRVMTKPDRRIVATKRAKIAAE